jgi:outer membrane protein assembly factor BamE (lipoprotein component of BamABCDE complex)
MRNPLSRAGLLFAAATMAFVGGCATQSQPKDDLPTKQAALTPGGAKLNLVKGKTTQAEVQEAFGTPDLVTHQDNQQIWTYDKTTYEADRRSDYFTILIAGTSGDRVRSSSKSTILRIYFDANDVVTDYRLSAVRY